MKGTNVKNPRFFTKELIHSRIIILILTFLVASCFSINWKNNAYKTRNHIIVVIDGVRFSESWGDSTRINIPNLSNQLAPQAVLFTNFYNFGITKTISGHAALTTGFYEELDNSGTVFPSHPSIFQRWLKFSMEDQEKAWFITSKGKLAGLQDTRDPDWTGKYLPSMNCGIDGKGLEAGLGRSGYREDAETWEKIQHIFNGHNPSLVLINLKAPDTFSDNNGWTAYLQAVRKTDEYVNKIWELIQSNPFYKDKTALYITSDHGRHLNGIGEGFLDHGDDCDGCQHVSLLALGPDFRKGLVVNTKHQLIDLPVTIATMFGFKIPESPGYFLEELFY